MMRHIQMTVEEHSALCMLLSAVKLEWEDNNRWTSAYQKALESLRTTTDFVDLKPRILEFADALEGEAEGESMKQAIVYEGIAARIRKEFA